MPRSGRLLYDGAYYHITQRGHNKEPIFTSDWHYLYFKKTVRKYASLFSFDLYNYCLMPNHIHMLLRIGYGHELPKLFQGILQTYGNYFKRKSGHTGYLYQGRYNSFLVKEDAYLLECARYIERNPVRAGIVENPADYRWSSYRYYARGALDKMISPNPAYLAISADEQKRREIYKDYVNQTRIYEELIDEVILR